jgi:hypothetical protein
MLVWRLDSRFGRRPVVIFDGFDDFLKLDGALLTKDNCTIVAVANDFGTSGHREILSNWNGTAGNSVTSMFLGLTGEKTIRFTDNFADAGKIDAGKSPFILTAVNGPQGVTVYQDGAMLASRPNSLSPRKFGTDWVIGTQGNINGEFWKGGIAELRVYSHPLTNNERQELERQLSQRYEIPLKQGQNESKPLNPETLALASLCHVLLNSNEFLHID